MDWIFEHIGEIAYVSMLAVFVSMMIGLSMLILGASCRATYNVIKYNRLNGKE